MQKVKDPPQRLWYAATIHAYFDDRVYGGNGFEILWKETTQMTDLEDLARL